MQIELDIEPGFTVSCASNSRQVAAAHSSLVAILAPHGTHRPLATSANEPYRPMPMGRVGRGRARSRGTTRGRPTGTGAHREEEEGQQDFARGAESLTPCFD